VPYTVWNRGRLLGETDLGFVRCFPKYRTGWFRPTADGEKVMPIATGVSPALRAYVNRARHDSGERTVVHSMMDGSSEAADLAAAFQHLEALELELRSEDGTVVPTEDVGFQDTHYLLDVARNIETAFDEVRAQWQLRNEEGELSDMEDIDELDELDALGDLDFAWTADELGESELPRYQVHVTLIDEHTIP
jgi:hypothetical protein